MEDNHEEIIDDFIINDDLIDNSGNTNIQEVAKNESNTLYYITNHTFSFLIFIAVLFNISSYIFYYSTNKANLPIDSISIVDEPPAIIPDFGGIPTFDEKIEYDEKELNDAILKLGLPTWSRAYVHCSDPKSEVKCEQVIKAYRKILEWENVVKSIPKNDSTPLLIHTYTKNGGIGNRIMQETVASIVAMILGRAVSVSVSVPNGKGRKNRHPYDYPAAKTIRYMNNKLDDCGNIIPHLNVGSEDKYINYVFDPENLKNTHVVFRTVSLSSLIYMNQQVSDFAREFFGMFAQYFIMNYISIIPQRFLDAVQLLIKDIPADVRLFGVHLRFQWAGQFYSWSIEDTMKKVVPFIEYISNQKPTCFALASDSQEMMNKFGEHFKYIESKAMRMADGDHETGFLDIVMLMMCDECLLSYRSTFSNLVCMRTGKRPWYIEKDAPKIFLGFNSQGGVQHPIYHTKYWKIYLTNEYAHHANNEEALRYYFRYLAV
ncbi:hypothetical protein TRFO_15123 [Tritrichomonas foetus]|uniref:Uncharacterized protein n=1 Tax=Tritrichomonas foetus TaxID=1144522 RepID=A0A1J4KU91_9EUKA|nr:hypothetical protein TRFO_15123 [Tritrichomonas foetus]|eukprot:OHT14472.1 hypothetical protein TRFO_15123 [Tritrichomonas foetus]